MNETCTDASERTADGSSRIAEKRQVQQKSLRLLHRVCTYVFYTLLQSGASTFPALLSELHSFNKSTVLCGELLCCCHCRFLFAILNEERYLRLVVHSWVLAGNTYASSKTNSRCQIKSTTMNVFYVIKWNLQCLSRISTKKRRF